MRSATFQPRAIRSVRMYRLDKRSLSFIQLRRHACRRCPLVSLHETLRPTSWPVSARRTLAIRDATLASLLLLSFSGYLTSDINDRALCLAFETSLARRTGVSRMKIAVQLAAPNPGISTVGGHGKTTNRSARAWHLRIGGKQIENGWNGTEGSLGSRTVVIYVCWDSTIS